MVLYARGFPFSEAKNALVTAVGTKTFFFIMRFFLLCPQFGGFGKRGSTVATDIFSQKISECIEMIKELRFADTLVSVK